MQPTIEVRIPSEIWPRARLALRNLAIGLHADLHVRAEEAGARSVSFDAGGGLVELPAPDLRGWEEADLQTVEWRGIRLPQLRGFAGETPDLIGLAHYLFNDFEELRQESRYPDERYDIGRSRLASIHGINYLDRALREAFAPFGSPGRRPCGVILTHDLDVLSPRGLRSYPWTPRVALYRALSSLRRGRLRECLSYLLSFRELMKVDTVCPRARFEFLDWAAAESEYGFRSVFFVFAPDRKKSFRHDASYTFAERSMKEPKIILRDALRGLIERGFLIGPHLSRSSGYRREEIDREFESLSRELGVPVTATRNHWLWMKYSDWYQILGEKEVDFDFNQAAVGYLKGTSFPYVSTNHRTMVFPTTYMDDAVLKSDRLNLSEEESLELLSSQLDCLQETGGCIALSFHPSEDPPGETGGIVRKLNLYKKALALLAGRKIPVYLPAEAREVFDRVVVFRS